MGVVYKLKPEIIDFILEKKKANFNLSCRSIARLILEEFQVEVSKSSINALIKGAGLSMPVGRRSTKKKRRLGKGVLMQALPPVEPKPALPEIPAAPVAPAPAIPMPPPPEEKVKPEEAIIMPPEKEEKPLPEEKPAPELPVPQEEVPIAKEEVPVAKEEPAAFSRSFTGAVFLEAVDYLMGGAARIAEILNKYLGLGANDLAAVTRGAIYQELEEDADTAAALAKLQGVREASLELAKIFSGLAKEARYLRIDLDGGRGVWLDAQLHTAFPSQYIPDPFGLPLADAGYRLNKCFGQGAPFVILKAPGESVPPAELMALFAGFKKAREKIRGVVVLNSRFQEIESLPLPAKDELPFIFGLWPWQFGEYRRMKGLGEFKLFKPACVAADLYIAGVTMEIIGPSSGEPFILRGAAVKFSASDKVRMVILSNLTAEAASFEEIAKFYLEAWPDPEGALSDLNRKLESFSYGPAMPESFWLNALMFDQGTNLDIKSLFQHYFRALDAYFRQYFLPEECPNKDFFTVKNNLYNLAVTSHEEEGYINLSFEIPPDYPFRNELAYACSRLNERQVRLATGKRLFFKTP